MKILLLNLPWVKGAMHGVRAGSRWPHLKHKPEDRYLPFPFFLAYATSLLKKNGFEAKLLDAIAEGRDHDKTLSFIKEYSPTHLVVETSFITLQGDLDFLKALTHPCVKILVGPNTYIASGSFLQEHPYIDHIIKGEYEFPLLELVRSTDQRSRSVIVPNSLCDLNALPWPERNDVLLEKYHDTPGGIPEPSAQMIASRGCPFHCTFCLWPHVMFGGHSYRIRDHIDVINEMEWLAQRGFKSIYFDDDTFGLDKKWLKAFCEELIRRNRECRINVPWAMMTRADHMDREMLLLLKKAECAAIKYGVESSSPAILKNAGKEYDLIALERIVTLTKSLNIKVHLTFTLGLPGETHATARDSIAYSFHLDPDSVQFSLATPFPGTPFYDLVKGKGLLLTEDVSLYDGNYHVVARTEGLAAGEIMRYKKKAYFLWKIYDRCKRIGRPLPRLSKLFIYTSLYGVGTSYKKLLHFIKNSLQLRKRFHDRLRYLGFYHGEKAFIGPSIIQLDLTNDCNNDCIACWCNSPLLEEKRLTGTIKSMHLSFEKVKEVIDDAARLGTQEIFLSGGGEPFMHPNIMDIITYIKSKGLIVHINTNFTLLDEATIRTIVEHGVDFMTVSLWAGSPKVYSDTHPNKTEDDFRRIERLLKYVQCLRTPNAPPHVKLYHVISNINYRDLAMMYDIAVRTESESVEFALLDPIPGKTDVLMLNKEQRNEALASARSLAVTISEAERNGIPMPKIVQFDQFIRRLSDDRSERGEYDKGIIDSFPCYAGWVFSRILPDGNVNACLKAHRIPVGNINIDRFKDLWNSLNMKVFRKETAICEKISPFFSQIGNDPNAACGCHRGCDDLGRNMLFHRSLAKLNIIEKITLKTAAKIYRSNVGSR